MLLYMRMGKLIITIRMSAIAKLYMRNCEGGFRAEFHLKY